MHRPRIRKEEFGVNRCGGFTVIELIMVLLIVGIIAAVATSATLLRTDRELNPQVEALKGHLRYAQAMAMQSNVNWGIYIIDGSTYCLFREGNTDSRVMLPGENSLTYTLPAGFTVGPPLTIVAFSSGWGIPATSASQTASAATSNIALSMTKGSASATITVTKNTGFIP